jgi:hypothetical protein
MQFEICVGSNARIRGCVDFYEQNVPEVEIRSYTK